MKKIIAVLLSLVLVFALVGCASGEKETGENKTQENKTSDDQTAENQTSGKLKIGIIQYMSHPSLDNCYQGVKEALDASGLDYESDLQVGSSASADADCSNFAKNMVAENYDMIIAIATPAAQSAFAATADTDIPVIFCAVSDPVAAKLVNSIEEPGDLCTGTSDVLDLSAQVELIQSMQPDVKSIGILYTSSEDNSVSNLARFEEICKEKNIEVVATAIQNSADIPSAAEDLASKVDCINNFTDNNVVNSLSVVLAAADKYGIPVYGSEEEQVKNGCLASVSIDYVSLGNTTGNMAVDVLNGEDAATMAVQTIKDATPIINETVAGKLNIEIPADYQNAQLIK